jgi:pyridinium-3,5-bisthiocarboxylic acid mononucleotide nickel chelatase
MNGLTTLYFDLFSGAAGDMILGALIDAGVPLDEVRGALGTLAIDPDVVWTERVSRAGVSATRFCVRGGEEVRAHDHEHAHAHGHGLSHRHDASRPARARNATATAAAAHSEAHRTLAEIDALIRGSGLSQAGKARATQLFHRLGDAEAVIHGTTLDRVHLHEVGALDSIIDIVGTVHAMEWLAVDRVVASPLNIGGGMVRTAHGLYPVPAPATLRLLAGAPVYSGPQQVELVTPTGALLITDYAVEFGALPPMRIRASGYGAGSRDLPGTPNVTRVVIGEGTAPVATQVVVEIEAEIDDMNPQLFGTLLDRLLEQGAHDVFYTPVQMKKNRPGTLLTVVAPPVARERLVSTIFRETTTIGVRWRDMQRECLARERVDVQTPFGLVRMKVARRGGVLMNVSPEFDDCVAIAQARSVPVKDVHAAAMKAFLDSRTAEDASPR